MAVLKEAGSNLLAEGGFRPSLLRGREWDAGASGGQGQVRQGGPSPRIPYMDSCQRGQPPLWAKDGSSSRTTSLRLSFPSERPARGGRVAGERCWRDAAELAGHHPEPLQEPPRLRRRAGDHGGSHAGEWRQNSTAWDYCQEQIGNIHVYTRELGQVRQRQSQNRLSPRPARALLCGRLHLVPERARGIDAEDPHLAGEERELLQRALQRPVVGMALDIGIELGREESPSTM